MIGTESESSPHSDAVTIDLRARVESLEGRLKRVEKALAQVVPGEASQPDALGLVPDSSLHRPDKIPTGAAASPYLDAEQAAAYLGITMSSLYGIVERRHLVPLRGPRRRYRFTREMLDEYLRRRRERA
jgi:excisionase family DNA binding protein